MDFVADRVSVCWEIEGKMMEFADVGTTATTGIVCVCVREGEYDPVIYV